jgi:putative phage-type endonuclease
MKYVELEQGSNEWLAYRKKGIGASEISAIMGISPWTTPYQKWEEKVYGNTVQLNASMRRGMEKEEEARQYFQYKNSCLVEPKVVQHEKYPWLFASLDGIDMMGDIVLEIKWANKKVHELAEKGIVIDYYFCQCQAQMACTGVREMWFLSCYENNNVRGGADFILVNIKRDDLFIEKMIEICSDFYYNHMIKHIPPTLTEKDYKLIDDYEYNELCSFYLDLTEQENMIAKKKKELLEKIKTMSEGKNSCSKLFKATKFRVKGGVDYDSIPQLKDIDLEKYRKNNREQWKISKNENHM